MFVMILIPLMLVPIFAQQECNWNYGIPNDHNKVTDRDDRRNLIVNGEASSGHEYPWQVSIEPIGCGGSVISREYILTAAHCYMNNPIVVVGLNRMRIQGTFINHEDYDDQFIENDIAVIRLNSPLPCDDPSINAISLPEFAQSFNLDDCSAWVTGFGALQEGGFSPDHYQMHELQTRAWSTGHCNQAEENPYRGQLPQTQICGYTPNKPTEDSCQGDSGGPFKIDINADSKAFHEYVQVGIVSYGRGCGRGAGIYTDISEYKSWVLSKVPTANFKTVTECDREHYHEGIIDCDGTNCNLELPYCVNSPGWTSENGNSCQSYNGNTRNCFADKGGNYFASEVCSQCGYCRSGQDNTPVELTNEQSCSGGKKAVSIEIETQKWAKEISFTIGNDCGGSGFQNQQTYSGQCCLPTGESEIRCMDAYGDGWHGAQLKVGGVVKCGNFEAEQFLASVRVSSSGSVMGSSGGSGSSGSNAGAIAGGVIGAVLCIAILAFCWFYVWPNFSKQIMDGCDECFKSNKNDCESRAPLSPQKRHDFDYRFPAPTAPVGRQEGERRSSYWNNFHDAATGSEFPQAPKVSDRIQRFQPSQGSVAVPRPPAPKRAVAPPPPQPVLAQSSCCNWYYGDDNDEQIGPLNDVQLRAKIGKSVKPDTYVWNGESVADWIMAKEVDELKSLFNPAKPKRTPPIPPVVQSKRFQTKTSSSTFGSNRGKFSGAKRSSNKTVYANKRKSKNNVADMVARFQRFE